MKDSRATSWLNMGAAAARAGDRADARYYLEHAQVCDPDPEEQAQIWFWLSRVTDDPVLKRKYLQDVVISAPGHVEARRDLAILEGRLKPEEILDLGQPLPPVASERVGARRYVCPHCGGKLAYEAQRGALVCDYCGYESTSFLAPEGDDQVQEHDFLATLPTVRGHAWELPMEHVLACQGCGASFVLPPAQSTATCPYCGSAHVSEASSQGRLIAPEAVLPFSLTDVASRQQVQRWLAVQEQAPKDLPRRAVVGALRPVYMPFWTFNITGQMVWQGQTEAQLGDPPRSVSGVQPVLLDNVLVPASHTLPQSLIASFADFDLSGLLPYSPDLLANWPVEIYQIPLADASLVAHQRAFASALAAIRSSLPPGRSLHGLTYDSSGIVVESFKLVLLPIWTARYQYRDKTYQIAVNGQTGSVHGQAPRSGLRGLLAGILTS